MPLGTTCFKILQCCGGFSCCPDVPVPETLTAVVTSGCPALNGTLTLTGAPGDVPGDYRWTGRITISGCNDCTILEVTVQCLDGVWGLGWTVFRSDGVTVCVVFNVDGVTTLDTDCGPPVHLTLTSTHQFLADNVGVCCSDFTIVIDVTG